MCTGRRIRFLCPAALARNPLCPYYDDFADSALVYAYLWQQTMWVCCGNHRNGCEECPTLYEPGNIVWYDACALECDPCTARLKAERERETEEMGGFAGLEEGEESSEMDDDDDEEEEEVVIEDRDEEEEHDVEIEEEGDGDMDVELDVELDVCNCDWCKFMQANFEE